MTMDLLRVAAASVGSIIALFVLTKLLGYKQMSQLSMFDYINGISIGSAAKNRRIAKRRGKLHRNTEQIAKVQASSWA